MLTTLLLYPLFGAVAGVLAGLLGVGGGIVIVPALVYIFTAQGLPAGHMMQMALGTSLGTIMFTSLASLWAHHKHGAVNWNAVKKITPGILVGTFLGAQLAGSLSTNFLKVFFVCFLYYVSVQMFFNFKPKPGRGLPGAAGMFGAGGFIGVVSSLVGIGGGTLTVPFLSWCNIALHQCIGTSAAVGFPIALAGTLGYIVSGWTLTDMPPYSLGYVYLPGLVGIAVFSMFTAKYGARLAHSLPVPKLKKFFALFLLCVATKMLWGVL